MCGIAGYFGGPDPAAPARVKRMLAAQRHRGPDGAGMAVCSREMPWRAHFAADWRELPDPSPAPPECVLGHNLLAIQDPTDAARQPILAGELALVFNGEIYNFVELRQQLEREGTRFKSQGDTEVLLELWKRRGPECMRNLRGMFAFVVVDRRGRRLWAVRDPFGIKPFYYTQTERGFHFASEIRSLHAAGVVPRKLCPDAAVASAAAGINAFGDGATLYEAVHELPPGHLLTISDDRQELRSYYALPDPCGDLSGDAATFLLRDAAESSVRLHLRSRRRIATCLSGGLDSSTIACLIGRALGESRHDFQTFTICTAAQQDSELESAALVARQAGLRHTVIEPKSISPADVLEMIIAYETPNHVIGPINQFLLLREIARAGVTVVLDGQGGDELLSGYPWFVPVLLDEIRRRHGEASAIEAGLATRPPLPAETMAAFSRMFHDPAEWVKAFVWQGSFLGWSIEQVLSLAQTQYYLSGGGDWRAFRRRQYLRSELQYLLRQEDRLGMWFGLECRVPLVDVPLVEVASQLAPDWLLHDGYLKYPFRVMLPDLPDDVRWNTTKRGFWETDRDNFPWVRDLGRRLVLDSRPVRELFPPVEAEWDRLSFDQHWRLLQLAVLDRCATREHVDQLCADLHVGT